MIMISGRLWTMIVFSGDSFKCILLYRLGVDPPEQEGQG